MTEKMSSEAIEQLVDDFKFFEDDFDRYTYLTHLGNLIGLPADDLKSEKYKVAGCQSDTWVRIRSMGSKTVFEAYSDTHIVRGILYILKQAVEGVEPAKFSKDETLNLFKETGLLPLLSDSRRSGLSSILDVTVRQLAQLRCIR